MVITDMKDTVGEVDYLDWTVSYSKGPDGQIGQIRAVLKSEQDVDLMGDEDDAT